MRKYIVMFLLLSFLTDTFSQNQNSVWCFGDSAGIDFSNIANPIPIQTSMDGRGSCASISDSIGNLLFYANSRGGISGNTTRVWNKNHQLMQNGDSIVGEAWFNEITIIPFPDTPSYFYLFTLGGIAGSSQTGFYYSILDLSLNGNLGAVIQKNTPLLNDEMADCVKTVKHGNGRDWWVIAKLSSISLTHINRFFVFLISPLGISAPIIHDLGNAVDGDFQRFSINNIGNKLMLTNTMGLMTEYDFDRCTGLISNPNNIFTEQTSDFSRLFWEGAYAPNDSLFYVTTTWYSFPNDTSRLLQYNLFVPDIPASCDTLIELKHPVQPSAVRQGPDQKIYISSFYDWGFPGYPYPDTVYNQYNMNLSVVNSPDIDGVLCNFQPFSFYLGGKRTYWGLPNNPNYELGRWVGSPCDTITSGIEESTIINDAEFYVFYHSGWQQLFVNAKNIKGNNSLLQIFDLSGKEVFSSAKKTQPPYFTQDVNCSNFANGLYIVSLTTEKERLIGKFVKK
ncbi:MAG: T9SS type A sorting domain-containing protein [Bacteroidota bacterium]